VYDVDVVCDAEGCTAPDGSVVESEPLVTWGAIVSREASRFQPSGTYVYAEMGRRDGRLALLEVDVASGIGQPYAVYSEWQGDEQVFYADNPRGTVAVAPDQPQGRFLLRFVDPGPDGISGTDDDDVRVLADGAWARRARSVAAGAPLTGGGVDDGWGDLVDVIVDWDLEVPVGDTAPVDDLGDGSEDVGCGGEDTGTVDDSGCGGEDIGDSGGDAGGCEGDTGGDAGCDGGGGGSGCDGGGDLGGGGCAGGGGGGCQGDIMSQPVAAHASASHTRGPKRLAPLVLLGLLRLGRRSRR